MTTKQSEGWIPENTATHQWEETIDCPECVDNEKIPCDDCGKCTANDCQKCEGRGTIPGGCSNCNGIDGCPECQGTGKVTERI